MHFVSDNVVYPYSSTDTATTWKKSHFTLSKRSDFQMINDLLIAVNAFTKNMLSSLSEDEMLLPGYVNLSSNFKGQPL